MAQFVYYRFNNRAIRVGPIVLDNVAQTIGNILYFGRSLISAGSSFGLRRKIWFNRVSTYRIPPVNLPSKTLSIALNIDASGSFSGFCVYWVIPESVTLTSSF